MLLKVSINSFSYNKGIPVDESGNGGGFVFDCRAINNPNRYEKYKQLTGTDPEVIEFFKKEDEMQSFLNNVYAIVDQSVEKYLQRQFTNLMVSFGCTGGLHRSVYCAEMLARHLKKKFNILRYNFRHNEEYSPYPLTAKIEINGTCNLDCIMCLRKSLPNRDKEMSYLDFLTVLNNLPTIIEWSPHGYNEPMLHPLFFNYIEETNKRKIDLILVSNGTALNKENLDKLLALKPKLIRISVDGVGKKYEEIRKNSSWDRVYKNLRNLSRKTDNFSLYATIWSENIDQILHLVNLAWTLDCKISFTDITWKNDFQESKQENSIRENFSEIKIKEIKDQYLDNENINFSIGRNKKRKCTLPWSSVYVDVVGDVFPCTDTLNYKMGNLLEEKISEIYNNDKYRQFRKDSISGKNYECKNCLAWAPMKNV